MAIIGKRLKTARENAKLTQMNAAKKLGISNGTLSGYERNYRDPDTEILNNMADLYEVSVEWLMGRTDNVNESTKPDQEEAEFQAFANNPSLQKWYKELPKSKEEDLERLRMMWEILKKDSN